MAKRLIYFLMIDLKMISRLPVISWKFFVFLPRKAAGVVERGRLEIC